MFKFYLTTLLFISICAEVPYFADNGFSNLLNGCTTTPTGEYYNGVTYLTYQGPHEDPYVASYNHMTKTWKGPFKVLVNELGLYPEAEDKKQADNHGKPTLVISNDGYINIIISGHGGCSKTFGMPNNYGSDGCSNSQRPNGKVGRTTHARSVYPENIEAWYKEDNSGLSPFSTYASSVKMDNGDIYIIYRHGTHVSDWVYQKSNNGGVSFQSPVSILKHHFVSDIRNNTAQHFATWYASCFASTQNKKENVIGCQFTHHYHESGPGNQHGPIRIDGYYLEIDTQTGNLTNGAGAELVRPVTLYEANRKARIFNSAVWNVDLGRYEKWNYDIGGGTFNSIGEPVLLFHRSAPGPDDRNNIEIYYWRYNKILKEWDAPSLLFGSKVNGIPDVLLNIESDDKMPLIVTLEKYSKPEKMTARYMEVENNGADWKWIEEPTMEIMHKNLQMKNIRNAHKDARALVAVWHTKQYYRLYLFGDNGVVPRQNETEANNLWVRCYNALTPEECYNDKNVMFSINDLPDLPPFPNRDTPEMTPTNSPTITQSTSDMTLIVLGIVAGIIVIIGIITVISFCCFQRTVK